MKGETKKQMPKIYEEEPAEETDDEEMFDEEELEETPKAKPLPPLQRKGEMPSGLKAYQEKRRQAQAPQPQAPAEPKRRYGIVPAQPIRIVDVEGQEVVAEGEYLIAQALADIIERLERIENTIGSMTQ